MESQGKKKTNGFRLIIVLSLIIIAGYGSSFGQIYTAKSQIVRITRSKDAIVKYPALSNDGEKLLYLSETRDLSNPEVKIKSIKIINADGTEEKVLFTDRTIRAPSPHDQSYLLCGTRPPLLSGDGTKAIFSLSINERFSLNDHYLGVVNTDGTGFRALELKNVALSSINWKEKGFKDDTWSRISNYAVSNNGRRLVLIIKGHNGPRRFGFPSGLMVMHSDGQNQMTLFSPDFEEERWVWRSYPRKPYTEGGWAFALSGNGEKILIGAQSSVEKDDYDLYLMNWEGSALKKITDFRDRFFTLADLSNDGQQIVFFYGGKKRQGIGTYIISSDGTGLEYLKSIVADRVDFEDMDSKGKRILYRHKNSGILMDLESKKETIIFHPKTPGYASSEGHFMDFPNFPSFWNPHIMTEDEVIITGTPKGRVWREFYLLTFTHPDIE